jgi:hypothetical protein
MLKMRFFQPKSRKSWKKTCNLQKNCLSLQCVFHSIRFKVNNSARSGEPLFLPISLDSRHSTVPIIQLKNIYARKREPSQAPFFKTIRITKVVLRMEDE